MCCGSVYVTMYSIDETARNVLYIVACVTCKLAEHAFDVEECIGFFIVYRGTRRLVFSNWTSHMFVCANCAVIFNEICIGWGFNKFVVIALESYTPSYCPPMVFLSVMLLGMLFGQQKQSNVFVSIQPSSLQHRTSKVPKFFGIHPRNALRCSTTQDTL